MLHDKSCRGQSTNVEWANDGGSGNGDAEVNEWRNKGNKDQKRIL